MVRSVNVMANSHCIRQKVAPGGTASHVGSLLLSGEVRKVWVMLWVSRVSAVIAEQENHKENRQ